jgi:hypothetical protein
VTPLGSPPRTRGTRFDPKPPGDRDAYIKVIKNILENPDEIGKGSWRGIPGYGFYIRGNDAILVRGGKFVSTLKDGLIGNGQVKNARVTFRRPNK